MNFPVCCHMDSGNTLIDEHYCFMFFNNILKQETEVKSPVKIKQRINLIFENSIIVNTPNITVINPIRI